MRLLIVTSVQKEADAVGEVRGADIVVSGVGRVNAACATTQALLERGPFDAALSAGVAGALPKSKLSIGDAVLASTCIYVEEGLLTPSGFIDMATLGFPLGDFEGNEVPTDPALFRSLESHFRAGRIATVATGSGTDDRAFEVVAQTGAIAEAMEGAAVVHAARRLGIPAIELRTISNTTGDRPRQQWDLHAALTALGGAVRAAVEALRASA